MSEFVATEERRATVSRLIGTGQRVLGPSERQLVADEIVAFLAEQSDTDPANIHPGTDLVDDLGVDSLTFLELFQELESQYNLDIEIRAVARYARDNPVQTVGQLVDQICLFLENKIDLAAAE